MPKIYILNHNDVYISIQELSDVSRSFVSFSLSIWQKALFNKWCQSFLILGNVRATRRVRCPEIDSRSSVSCSMPLDGQ